MVTLVRRSSRSKKELGQPWRIRRGVGWGPLPRSWTAWTARTSISRDVVELVEAVLGGVPVVAGVLNR